MKMNTLGKVIGVAAVIAIVGFAATSFAGWGRGGGYCLGQGQGPGWGQRGGWGPGFQGNLNDQDIDKLNQDRQAFFESTRDLREKLNQKELELRAEMAKQDPDVNKAVNLQKEVSDLEGQLDQKRVEQRVKMQKENPEFFAERGYRRGYGYGPRGGMGMGYGPRGGMGMGYGPRGGMGMGYGPRGGWGMGYGPGGGGMGRGFAGGGGGCWQ